MVLRWTDDGRFLSHGEHEYDIVDEWPEGKSSYGPITVEVSTERMSGNPNDSRHIVIKIGDKTFRYRPSGYCLGDVDGWDTRLFARVEVTLDD